jgi:hypothetical protein
MSIAEIRQKYPQYDDLSDDQLAEGLHRKFYADMPLPEFRAKIGLSAGGASGSWGRGGEDKWADPRLEGLSQLERYRLGVKTSLGEQKLGVQQVFGNETTPQDVDAYRAANAGLLEDPTVRSGQTGAQILTSLPMAAAPVAGIPGLLANIGMGGLYGGVQPVGSDESRVDKAVTGAAWQGGGTALGQMLGRVFQPIRNVNRPEEQAAVDALRNEGAELSVAQQTGSPAARMVERGLASNPFTASTMAERGQRAARSFTRAVLRTFGEQGEGLTPQVAERANTRIGDVFNDVNSRYQLDVTNPQIANQFNNLDRRAAHDLLNDPRIRRYIETIRTEAQQNGGRLSAQAAQNIRTGLGGLSRQAGIGPFAFELREILDDALQQATRGTDDYARLGRARGEYRNLQAAVQVADTTNRGLIHPAGLAQHLKSNPFTKNAFRYGGANARLEELARHGSTLADRFPDSGTALRLGTQAVLPGAAALGTAVFGESDRTPAERALDAAKWAGATYALPTFAASALTNPRVANYLSQGIGRTPLAEAVGNFARRTVPGAVTSQQLNPLYQTTLPRDEDFP